MSCQLGAAFLQMSGGAGPCARLPVSWATVGWPQDDGAAVAEAPAAAAALVPTCHVSSSVLSSRRASWYAQKCSTLTSPHCVPRCAWLMCLRWSWRCSCCGSSVARQPRALRRRMQPMQMMRPQVGRQHQPCPPQAKQFIASKNMLDTILWCWVSCS